MAIAFKYVQDLVSHSQQKNTRNYSKGPGVNLSEYGLCNNIIKKTLQVTAIAGLTMLLSYHKIDSLIIRDGNDLLASQAPLG